MHVSLQSYSKLVFRNKIIDNFEDFSLLLFSHRICPVSENILSQRTDVATHYSVKSEIQCLPVFFTNAEYYWFLEAFNSIQFNLFHFPKNPLQNVNHMDIEIVKEYIYIYKVIQIYIQLSKIMLLTAVRLHSTVGSLT